MNGMMGMRELYDHLPVESAYHSIPMAISMPKTNDNHFLFFKNGMSEKNTAIMVMMTASTMAARRSMNSVIF